MLPVLFTLPTPWGPQPVYAYGVMLGLSLIVGFQIAERVGSRDKLERVVIGNAYLVAAAAGMIGARLLYVLENHDSFSGTGVAHWLDVTAGGVSVYGGFAAGLLASALYLRNKPISVAAFGDAAAPSLALGTLLTRIGCYLYGCDFGTPLSESAPGWLKHLGTFPRWNLEQLGIHGSPAFLYHQERYGLPRDATASLPVHPTQLYEALCGAALLALSIAVARRRTFAGQVILSVAFSYALFRFGLEYVRDEPDRAQAFGFSSAQLFSLVLGAGSAIAYSLLRSGARRPG